MEKYMDQHYPLFSVRMENCADNQIRVRCVPIVGWNKDLEPITVGHNNVGLVDHPDFIEPIHMTLKKQERGAYFSLGISATPVASQALTYRIIEQWLTNDIYGQVVNINIPQVQEALEIVKPLAAEEPPPPPPKGQVPPGAIPMGRGPNGKSGGNKNKGRH